MFISKKLPPKRKIASEKYPDARLNINLALFECFFFSIMVASTESYINYFAVKSGITDLQLALLTAGPLCLGAFAQLLFPRMIKDKDLQKSIVFSQFLQAIGVLGIIYSSLVDFQFLPIFLSLSVYWIGGSACGPLWLDWVGGLFPRKFYRYFLAEKSRLICLTTLICYPLISLLMKNIDWIKPWHLFSLGFVARICSLSIQIYLGHKSKHLPLLKYQVTSDKVIFHPLYPPNFFKKFLIFFGLLGLFKLSVNISSPFFLPYMLKDLGFTQLEFVFLTTIPLISRAIFGPFWAKRAYGKKALNMMQLSVFMIGLTPLFWILSGNLLYLSLVEFYSGIFWSAFELGIILLVQQAVLVGPRTLMGEQMAFINLFGLAGSIIGAKLLNMGLSSHHLFWLSSSLRIASALLLIYFSTKIFMLPLKLQEMNKYITVIPLGLRKRFLRQKKAELQIAQTEKMASKEKNAS